MSVAGKTIMVTGANRGIGRALIDEAVARGAARVYAGTRQPLTHADSRITPVALDVTDPDQVRAAAGHVGEVDMLINNAGIFYPDGLDDRAAIEQHLAVNLFGTWNMIQAFLPALTRSGGAIVNNVSLAALALVPSHPAYSVSKAAAFNLTQSLRGLLAQRGVRVHAALTGPVDTDMIRTLDIPKSSPETVAKGIFDGVGKGEDEIFPDPLAASLADLWHAGAAKALERQNTALLAS